MILTVMKSKILLALISLLICLGARATADNQEDIPMRYITAESGLAGETASKIIADRKGQIWIATNNGVSYYNGVKMVTVPIRRESTKKIYVYDICASDNQNIYIATQEGVFRLLPHESAFTKILPEITPAETLFSDNGTLYVGNRNGLHIVNGKDVKTIQVSTTPMSIENGVRSIRKDGKGNIWFTSKYALNKYAPKTQKVESFNLTPWLPKAAALSHLAIAGDKIYVGTKNHGLYTFSQKTRQVKYVPQVGNIICSLNITAKGSLTVGTDGSGAYLVDTKTDLPINTYNTNGKGKHKLPTDVVYCYYRDDNGVDWFGFYRYGLAYTYRNDKLFRTYRYGDFTTEGLNVRSFFIRDSVYLMGTFQGLALIDEPHHVVRHFTTEELGGIHIITDINYYNGYYYIASYDAGVRKINARTFEVSKLAEEPILGTTSVTRLAVSPDHHLWIGTGEGLFIIDEEEHVTQYTENNSNIMGSGIICIYFDAKDNVWLGGSLGLTLYSNSARHFVNTFPKGFFDKEHIREISRGHDGKIYFTTRSGIYYTNESMRDFGKLALPAFLAEEGCYSFLDDQKGNYWFSMENGLFRMDYEMKGLVNFGYGEGLDCRLINSDLMMQADGKIWLGTSNGLKSIDPNQLAGWQRKHAFKVVLYDIVEGSTPIDFGKEREINDECNIDLPWNIFSSPVSLKVLLNDYARPYGRLYEYRMNGESEWHILHAEEPLRLTHLLLGTHELEVRLAGVSRTTRTYTIVVHPSALALAELALLIIAVVLYVLWIRYRRYTKTLLQEREDIEKALIEVETEQQNAETSVEVEKYRTVKIDEKECGEIVDKMRKYIEQTKIYTNQDMKMSDLADYLHLSSSKLSQVFNLYLHENYYEFINKYRLQEFKQLIEKGEAGKYTIIALSEKCGFKKSSFFSTFRKIEGMTPTEYLKKNNIVLPQ